jgi:hypothetical protein
VLAVAVGGRGRPSVDLLCLTHNNSTLARATSANVPGKPHAPRPPYNPAGCRATYPELERSTRCQREPVSQRPVVS